MPEGRRLFPDMTVRENLEMGAYVRSKRGAVDEAIERCYALFPVLKEKAAPAGGPAFGRPAADGGDRPRADVAPEAPAARRAVPRRCADHHRGGHRRRCSALSDEGVTLLLVEQNIHRAMDFVARAYVIENGRTVLEGDARVAARRSEFHQQVSRAGVNTIAGKADGNMLS